MILAKVKKWLGKKYSQYNLSELRRSPFLWLYAAYLTLKYVDNFNQFPAIKFSSYIKVFFKKGKGSSITILKRLVFEPFMGESGVSTLIVLHKDSTLTIEGEFVLGNGVRISINTQGSLIIKGREFESASGITANAVIMVDRYLEIGRDCIIAWDTFITDCDWHAIQQKAPQSDTIIGDHVWVGVGAKILKGAIVGKNSIIAAGTVVLRGSYTERSLIAGVPGKVTKAGIPMWKREMTRDFNEVFV